MKRFFRAYPVLQEFFKTRVIICSYSDHIFGHEKNLEKQIKIRTHVLIPALSVC